jgi:formiminotetrahydrofolate cyclodeaminase
VAFAASLVAMVARSSGDAWNDANGISAQALLIKHRAVPLAATDAEAWQAASESLRAATADSGEDAGGTRLEQALERAAAVPLEVSELAADVAALAALVAENCEPAYRADAAAAAALASGAARAAAHLVEVNLAVHGDDQRLARALASADVAADHAGRVLASIR